MGPEKKHQQKEPSKRRQKLTGVRGKQELKYRGSAGVTLRGPDVIPDPGSCGPFPEKLPWAPVCVMELVRTNQASVCHWDSRLLGPLCSLQQPRSPAVLSQTSLSTCVMNHQAPRSLSYGPLPQMDPIHSGQESGIQSLWPLVLMSTLMGRGSKEEGVCKSHVLESNGREAVPQMACMSPTPSAEQEG